MMLSRPDKEEEQEREETAVLQRPTPLPASLVKKKTAEDAVADLERRLQMLGGGTASSATSSTSTTTGVSVTAAVAAPRPVATANTAPAPATAAIPKAGKNALLVSLCLFVLLF
jgi:hypothetical protein